MSALDRTPVSLLDLPAVDQLDRIALWLDDCDTHLSLRLQGGLPMPPFGFMDAWISVLVAKETRQALDAQLAAAPAPPQPIAILATQEWFEPREKTS